MFILGDDFLGKSCVNSAKKLPLVSELWNLATVPVEVGWNCIPFSELCQQYVSPFKDSGNSYGGLIHLRKKYRCVCVKRGWKEDAVFLLNWTLRLFGDLFWIAKIERTTLLPKFRGGMKWQKPKGDSTLLQHHVQFQDPLHAWNLQLLASSGGLPTSARCPSHQDIFKKYVHIYKYYIHIRADCPINNS